uniref:SpaA isopeptide-forming pilin-related protein n=1 Tax=Faecalibaculum rodentium TaxID=1702221 RepID=UPI0023EFD24E
MRKGKLFTGKAWKRMVRILSCIVVFCTTYALILPAITQEAQAYCGSSEHKHTEQCYKEILSCTREEHVYSEECFDADGSLICTLEEHTHSDECYRELLECTEEEHTHSLECFSDPEADKETEEDWKKTVPDEDALKDKSDTEKVLMIAESQKGCRESEKNYVVENETEKKGITRYGQWDEDPYEDWAGAYARFVLHYAGIETAEAKKHTSDWLEQLHDKGELKAAEEAEAGDVLFVYDEKDQLKAGIVSEVKDGTVKAWMGDWDNQVQEKTFSKTDVDVHSVWKAIQKEESTDPEQPEEPTDPEVPTEDEQKPEEDPKADEKKPAEEPKDEETVVTYDFTQEVEAEDGARIKVSWNEGTFETEDVVFQAKKVELTEEENAEMDSHLDSSQEYYVRVYDLSFYNRGDLELEKIEPSLPVNVEITFPEIQNDETVKIGDSAGVFHFNENGTLDILEDKTGNIETNTEDETGIHKVTENSAEFTVDSFSKFAFPYSNVSDDQWYMVENADAINTAINQNWTYIRLKRNLFNQGSQVIVSSGKNIVLDLDGFALENNAQSAIKVEQGGKLVITNRAETKENGTTSAHWGPLNVDNNNDNVALNSKDYISYKDENGTQKKVENAGIITTKGGSQAAIEVYDSGSTLEIQRGVGITSDNGSGIKAYDASIVTLGDCYVCHNKQSGVILHEGPTLNVNDGAVISMNDGAAGGGIYADSTRSGYEKKSSTVYLNENSLISYNSADLGGGICIGENKEFCDKEAHDTTGFETANTTQYSKLLMSGGTIVGNIARIHEGGGIALRFNSGARGVLKGGVIKNNQALNNGYNHGNIGGAKDWGGGGVFASQGTFLWMPNGADITGNKSDGLGGGLTGCSTGKIILDPSLNIYNNTAEGTGRTHGSDKQKDVEYLNEKGNTYKHDNWKGADIFGAEKTQVTGPVEADFEGLAGANVVRGSDGATIRSDDWLVLENLNKSGSADKHDLLITGNSSTTHGGGVLINGWLVTGASELKMFGDDIGLTASKKLQNVDGQSATATRRFNFKVTDNPDGDTILSTGYVDGSGNITFSNRLVVNPEEILTQGLGVNNTTTLDYYLSEVEEKTSTVKFDKTTYKLHFTIKCTSSTTVSIPYWNPETEAFETKSVTIEEYQIDSLQVSERQNTSSDFGNPVSVQITGTPKSVDLRTILNHSATFTNTLIDKQKISVEKKWGDQANHSNDFVTVYLKRYLKEEGQSPETAVIVKAVTLNSNRYRGTAQLPSGVTREYTGTGIWKKSWDEDFQVVLGNTEYVYLVEEECSNHLYAGTATSTVDITYENTPGTSQVDALVPVSTMTQGSDYYIISPFENKMLNVSGYTRDNGWWITPNHIVDVKKIENVDGDVVAYNIPSNIDTYKIRYSNFGTGGKTYGGLTVHPGGDTNEGWIYYHDDGSGLVISYNTNYESSNTKGYRLSNDYLQINVNDGWQDVTYSSSTKSFGTREKNDGQGVRLYQKGKVTVSSGSTTGGSANQSFVITNNKAPDVKFTLNVIKEDSEDNTKLLPGAEFKLSRIEGVNTTVLRFTGSTGSYIALADGDPAQGTEIVVTDASGKISISNLPIGIYELEETKAPDGYTLPHDAADRKLQIDINGESTELDPTNLSFTKEITNTLLTYELPETGSAGTKIYTATGTILLLTCLLYT